MSSAGGSSPGPAEVIDLGDAPPPRTLRQRVLGILAEGGLVGLPTETVYGLAARADHPGALERLRGLKGRDPQLPLTWHVASRDVLESFEELRPLVRRLAERYWPGPLSLVLEGVPEGLEGASLAGWTGVRLPAHRATRGFLEAAGFPIVMSSANVSGESPLCRAAEVSAAFPQLELVVDGGDARLGESSGVLRLGRGHFELLRPGLLTLRDLRSAAGLRIAFVCTGNTCRSPMAEGLARDLLARRLGADTPVDPELFGFEISSAGVAASFGSSASPYAVEVLASRGIDIASHGSSAPTPERLAELDHVYCMTAAHLARLRELASRRVARSIELLDPEGRDVPDPIGGSRADYERCAAAILRAIELRSVDWA